MTPLFLISLPRSGSTLLQRLIMSHDDIASKSEPWIMLPLVYMLKPGGVVSEYNHWLSHCAVDDFINQLPNKKSDYFQGLNEFASKLYALQCANNESFFLDKTPRYYLIINELANIFPNAKFIFLVRHPAQIIASIISTFSENTLRNLHFYQIDIFQGFDKMAEGMSLLKDRSVVVRYEDLISDKHKVVQNVFDFLDLSYSNEIIENLDDRGLDGRLGDKAGTYKYSAVENASLDKWKEVFNEKVRKNYLKNIVSSLDENSLAVYGYEKSLLLSEINELKSIVTLNSFKDIRHILSSKAIKTFHLNLYRKKIRNWSKDVLLS